MRGKRAEKRDIKPDPKYKSVQLAKFINYIMERGKKSTAQGVVYDCFEIIEKQMKKKPLEVFEKAIQNIGPMLEVRGRRIGGANYQIPYPVSSTRRYILASRWLIEAAKGRKGKPMGEKLALEIMDAYNNTGAAIKKKEDTHRMAEANKAFAHFAR